MFFQKMTKDIILKEHGKRFTWVLYMVIVLLCSMLLSYYDAYIPLFTVYCEVNKENIRQ